MIQNFRSIYYLLGLFYWIEWSLILLFCQACHDIVFFFLIQSQVLLRNHSWLKVTNTRFHLQFIQILHIPPMIRTNLLLINQSIRIQSDSFINTIQIFVSKFTFYCAYIFILVLIWFDFLYVACIASGECVEIALLD